MDLKDYLRIIRRRWAIIVVATGCVITGALFITPRPADIYLSVAQIIVQDPPFVIMMGADRPRLVQETINSATQITLIKTREVLEFALAQNPELARHLLGDSVKPGEDILRRLPIDDARELERIRTLPPSERRDPAVRDKEAALVKAITEKKTELTGVMDALKNWTSVDKDRDSSIVSISARHENQELAQQIASAVTEGFLAYSVEIPKRRIQFAIDRIVREQIEPLQKAVDDLRARQAGVKRELEQLQPSAATLSDAGRALQRQIEQLTADAKALREQREALEAQIADAQIELRARGVVLPEAGPEAPPQRTMTLRLLDEMQGHEMDYRKSLFNRTPAHPAMRELQKQMEFERGLVAEYADQEKILMGIDRKLARARGLDRDRRRRDGLVLSENRVAGELEAARKKLYAESPTPPLDAKQLAEIQERKARLQEQEAKTAGELAAKEKQLQDIVAEKDKLDISQKTFTPLVQKVVEARRADRLPAPRQTSWAMAVVVGLALGLGAAYFLEYLNTTLRTEQDIRRYVNLPLLGVVVHIREPDQRLLLNVAPKSPLSELFNTIGTLMESYAAEYGAKVFVVASSQAGEGKSTVTSNLAVALARGGRRVILVDADMRKAVLHKFFNVDNARGLASYLAGNGRGAAEGGVEPPALEALLKPTEVEGLRILTAGPHPQNPVGLLKSGGFKDALDRLRGLADIVLVDVPPVHLAVDTMVVASLADAVLLLVSANETNKDEVTYAKRVIEAGRGKLIGCILNKATHESHGYYYYYYYYYDSYKYYRES